MLRWRIGRPAPFSTLLAVLCSNSGLCPPAFAGTGCGAEEKLVASDGATPDLFGYSVDVFDTFAVGGSPFDDFVGSAYIYQSDCMGWTQDQKLVPSDGDELDEFGFAAAISGNWVAVGSPGDDAVVNDSGAVYLYKYNGVSWAFSQKLKANDAGSFDRFGGAVDLDGDIMVVGAHLANSPLSDAGAAYVFRFNGASWVQEQKLVASDAAASDSFGDSVAVDASLIAIGAFRDDVGPADRGSVYLFRHDGATWIQEVKLTADDGAAGDAFGDSVGLLGDVVAVGAPFDDNEVGADAGAVYAYRYEEVWEESKLLDANGHAGDWFGRAVSVSPYFIVAGAPQDDSPSTDAGSASTFVFDGMEWRQARSLVASDQASSDFFASSVAAFDYTIVAGAPYDDTAGGASAGSAYAFVDVEGDCDCNGVLDACDIALGADDCNGNGRPDNCDVSCRVELVFALDTSGSFGKGQSVCSKINNAIGYLGSIFDLDVSVMGISQSIPGWGCPGSGSVVSNFGSNVPYCDAGVPSPDPINSVEDWAPAVSVIAGRAAWGDDTVKVIAPASDEGPQDGDPVDQADHDAIDHAICAAGERGAIVVPIMGTEVQCAPPDDVCGLALEIADATGGGVLLTSKSDFGVPLRDIIESAIASSGCVFSEDSDQNGIPDECQRPAIQSVVSVNSHVGFGALGIPVDVDATVQTDSSEVTTETRVDGINRLEVTFAEELDSSVASLGNSAVVITPNPGVVVSTSLANGNMTLVLEFNDPLPDEETYSVALTDAVISDGPAMGGDRDFEIRALAGNVCSDSVPGPQSVNALDLGLGCGIRGHFDQDVTVSDHTPRDVDQSGAIDALDIGCVRFTCGVFANTAP